MKKIIKNIICLLICFVYYYLFLPPININNMSFWIFVSFIILVFYLSNIFNYKNVEVIHIKNNYKFSFKNKRIADKFILIIPLMFLAIFVINFFESPIFLSKKYASRITINKDKDFITDIKEVDFNSLPLLDKNSSQKLGDRVMGQMSDLVSQYSVSDLYTQINFNNSILRVTPLEYASFIKWINNRKKGVQGYIMVDSVSGETTLKRLDQGMKYLPSAYFNDNLYRKLRFKYPTKNFGKVSFEIDNEENPYWIITTIDYSGVGILERVSGVIVFNPINGESKWYDKENIPTWIDIAYSPELIIEQVDDWGTYQNGFFNSIFGQKNVVNTTDGYNYLKVEDDIYLYTGLTSIVSDESNLGFILTNMRTGETSFYSVPGAEEFSAMASAEGAVQQMHYTSTFPLLINLNNKPTYVVSLKDDAGLVKMYGFIDVVDYQKVIVTDSNKGIEEAATNYLNNIFTEETISNLNEKEIVIKYITSAIKNGNTNYYIVDTNNQKYIVSIDVNEKLPFLQNGDKVKVKYYSESDVINIKKIEIK